MSGGYGRGWSEPLATGRIARLRQIAREPATKTTWLVSLAIAVAIIVIVLAALPLYAAAQSPTSDVLAGEG